MEPSHSFIGKIANIDYVVCVKGIGYPKPHTCVGYGSVINNEKSKTLWL